MNKKLFQGVYDGKKVLITGDTGFKGSWLAIWLLELGAEVFGYSLPPKTENDNYVKTKLVQKINHKNGDVRDKLHLQKFFNETEPDFAFHLAAQPIVIESYNDPHYTFETNIMGTVNFFEAVRNTSSVKAAINITSDKCYQNNEWLWGYRENDPMGGKDPYSASKGCSELVTNSYLNSFFNKDSHCAIASARAGNVIGGGDWAEHRIVPDFFRAVNKNEKLIIRNPLATRPWQHVLEPLSGYLLLASKLYLEGIKFSGGWNFGPSTLTTCTVSELIDHIIKKIGKGSPMYNEIESGLHEAKMLKLDISKAIQDLNWKPVLNFQQLVEFTSDGYLDEFEGKNLYDARVNQIKNYMELAELANLRGIESDQ